jgi:predicted RNA methylase
LGIRYDKFTFIDLGSGKGRAIMVASSFPFKKIIGVEYSRHLDKIARINLSHYPDVEKQCKDIDLICSDAELFPIPAGPLIVYIYNSFGKQVMNKVVKNILNSYYQDKRQIIVIYFNAEFADVLRNSGSLKEKRISKKNAIYATDYI